MLHLLEVVNEPLPPLAENGKQDVFLIFEIGVGQPIGDLCSSADIGDRPLRVPLGGKDLDRGPNETLPFLQHLLFASVYCLHVVET